MHTRVYIYKQSKFKNSQVAVTLRTCNMDVLDKVSHHIVARMDYGGGILASIWWILLSVNYNTHTKVNCIMSHELVVENISLNFKSVKTSKMSNLPLSKIVYITKDLHEINLQNNQRG